MKLVVATSWYKRLRGMLGSHAVQWEDSVLLLAPCNSIHTIGMRFSIDVAFVDHNGTVLSSYLNVTPQTYKLTQRGACVVLERAHRPGERWYQKGERVSFAL